MSGFGVLAAIIFDIRLICLTVFRDTGFTECGVAPLGVLGYKRKPSDFNCGLGLFLKGSTTDSAVHRPLKCASFVLSACLPSLVDVT